MRIESLTVGPFEENAWLVSDPRTGDAAIIDPGDEAPLIVAMIERSGVRLRAIWLTHAHIDHIGAVAEVKDRFAVPIHLHPADRLLYDRGADQAAFYGVPFVQPPPPDVALAEGDVLSLGQLRFHVWHVPGHAPGHAAFVTDAHVFGGDVLFAGSIGRTDLPLCDPAAMERSLERFLTLPDTVTVHPGHGPATSIGVERRSNPFLLGLAHSAR